MGKKKRRTFDPAKECVAFPSYFVGRPTEDCDVPTPFRSLVDARSRKHLCCHFAGAVRLNERIRSNAKLMQAPYHLKGQRAFAIEHLGDPRTTANVRFKV